MYGVLLYLCGFGLFLSIVLIRLHASGPDAKAPPKWLNSLCRLRGEVKVKPETNASPKEPITDKQTQIHKMSLPSVDSTSAPGHVMSDGTLNAQENWKMIAMRINVVAAVCFALITIGYCLKAVRTFSSH